MNTTTTPSKLFTAEQLQAHVKSGASFNSSYRVIRQPAPALVCADGFKVSVQASSTHYCEPKNNSGPYSTFELGYPSAEDELIQPYAETPETPTATVYAQVPLETVLALINKHGGTA